MKTVQEEHCEALQEEYYDCCDRLFLNCLAQRNMPTNQKVKKLIEKDEKIKEELEKELSL